MPASISPPPPERALSDPSAGVGQKHKEGPLSAGARSLAPWSPQLKLVCSNGIQAFFLSWRRALVHLHRTRIASASSHFRKAASHGAIKVYLAILLASSGAPSLLPRYYLVTASFATRL